MGLFQQRLAERRRQQHGAATLDITDLGTPDLDGLELIVRTSTPREQGLNLTKPRKPRTNQLDGVTAICMECKQPYLKGGHNSVRCAKKECMRAARRRQQADWREKKRAAKKENTNG